MHGAGIGPDQQIADLPFMAIDILRLRGPVAKLREQRAAFLGGQSDDVIGGGAPQPRLAPGLVRPDQRTLLAGRALPELTLVGDHSPRPQTGKTSCMSKVSKKGENSVGALSRK